MIVVTDHPAVAMAEPKHQHLFRGVVIGALRTEIVAEAVDPAVCEADFVWRSREERTQRRDDFADENISNGVWFKATAFGTMEKQAVGMARQAIKHRLQVGADGEGACVWCEPVAAA